MAQDDAGGIAMQVETLKEELALLESCRLVRSSMKQPAS